MAFGKRGQPAPQTAPAHGGERALDPVERELVAALRDSSGSSPDLAAGCRVPTSYGALLAAILAVVVVEMAFIMTGRNQLGSETAELAGKMAAISGRRLEGLTTLALMASVWSGARAVGMFALPAHFVLRRFALTSVVDYALGACACSALFLAASSLFGVAADPLDWTIGLAGGLAAGAVYRLVAGQRAL